MISMASFVLYFKIISLPPFNFFSAYYFAAFHKAPDDLTCTHPLGISTALYHLVGSLIMSSFHNEIIKYLLPDGLFGLAVPGGNTLLFTQLNPSSIDFFLNHLIIYAFFFF
jgi:hypothetical protein